MRSARATPNDALYWSLVLYASGLTNTANADIYALDTSADACGVKTDLGTTTMSGTFVPSGGSQVWYAIMTSTPGELTLDACVEYRLMVTESL